MSEYIDINARLEYLRSQIDAECISQGEVAELQGYGDDRVIPEDDVQLLEWAGVPEFPETYRVEIRFDLSSRYRSEIIERAHEIAALLEVKHGVTDADVTGVWDAEWNDVK